MPSVETGIRVCVHDSNIKYHVSEHKHQHRGALIDRGANGGVLGADAIVVFEHLRTIDVTGIDNHELTHLKIVDATARVVTNKGPVILILQQYAYLGTGSTIHSSGQLEWFGNDVHDKSLKVKGGCQCIVTHDGYIIPIDMVNGLAYIKMVPNTKKEFEELPHVVLTCGDTWDSSVLDLNLSNDPDWMAKISKSIEELPIDDGGPFDEIGEYKDGEPTYIRQETAKPRQAIRDQGPSTRSQAKLKSKKGSMVLEEEYIVNRCEHSSPLAIKEVYQQACELNHTYAVHELDLTNEYSEVPDNLTPEEMQEAFQRVEEQGVSDESQRTSETYSKRQPRVVKKGKFDYENLRPYFLHVPTEKVRKTIENTTQHAQNVMAGRHLYKTLRSRFPAFNVWRRNEPVATDTVFAETPAIGGGQKIAQFFVGRKSLVIDIFGMKTEKEFVNTLLDVIRRRGAMDKLISDSAKVEQSKRVQDVVRMLLIGVWQSEPHHQHQHFGERRWQNFKHNIQWFSTLRKVPGNEWLLLAEWIADVMNLTAERSLGWRTPIEVLTGQKPDISCLLLFLYGDIVMVNRESDATYRGQIGSQKQHQVRAKFVGFAKNVGHELTFKVLLLDTGIVVPRSRLRLLEVKENALSMESAAGDVEGRPYLRFKQDEMGNVVLPTIDASQNPFMSDYEPKEQKPSEDQEANNVDTSPSDSSKTPTYETPVVETVTESEDKSPTEKAYKGPDRFQRRLVC